MNRVEVAKLAREVKERNSPSLPQRFWCNVNILSKNECWEWKSAVRNKKEGYGAFWYEGRHHPSARIAYYLKHSIFETKLEICHKCDNPACCNPNHLFLGTRKENDDDKVRKKRHAFGEKNGVSILNDEKVRSIRNLRSNHTLIELGIMFGVSCGTICKVCKGETWNHVI